MEKSSQHTRKIGERSIDREKYAVGQKSNVIKFRDEMEINIEIWAQNGGLSLFEKIDNGKCIMVEDDGGLPCMVFGDFNEVLY